MCKINHLELFSGIGGFHLAFDLFGKDFGYNSNCVGFSEIDKYAVLSYKANYDVNKSVEMGDIVAFNKKTKNISNLPDFDILTGGFPCQSFSMMGAQKGFDDDRGNLFFEIIKILKLKKPNFVLLENVRNLVTHNDKKTFNIVKKTLSDIGYKYFYFDIFNTNNYSLAQTRNRVYMFASRVQLPLNFEFSNEKILHEFNLIISKTSLLKQKDVLDVLEKEVDDKYYLSEKIKPTILSDGSASYKGKSTINNLIAKPLTATMVKMHRACQDNYFSENFLKSKNPYDYVKINFSKDDLLKQNIRKITPQEALLLQGFSKDFYIKAKKINVSNHQLYKQAGNAASVNTIYAILYYLFEKCNILEY